MPQFDDVNPKWPTVTSIILTIYHNRPCNLQMLMHTGSRGQNVGLVQRPVHQSMASVKNIGALYHVVLSFVAVLQAA